MSLDFSYKSVRNWEELCEPDRPHQPNAKTTLIIHLLMPVGIGEITPKTVPEIWERIEILQALDGPYLQGGEPGTEWLTCADIERLIGLTTNIFPKETKAAFMRRMEKAALERVVRAYKHRRETPAETQPHG